MTLMSNGQFSITSKEEIFEKCEQSNFTDCRINAYPEYTGYKGIIRQAPNFIFIDLDLENFGHNIKKLDLVLRKTLKKIAEYEGFPTVLWTGNGYHIYLPISAIVLDQETIFSKDRFPNLFSVMGKYSNWSVSEVFLKYTEIFFTNGKADPHHKPKYKSCLIRIPGSYNSKLLNKGLGKSESLVKIIQRWNGRRIHIQYLLKDFRRWLIQEEYNQKLENKRKNNSRRITKLPNTYTWIENLLQTPLKDNRKYCIFHIIIPYLVNVKKLSSEEVFHVIIDWLSTCNRLRALDFNPSIEIRNRIRYVKIYKPIGLLKIKELNEELYRVLRSSGITSD